MMKISGYFQVIILASIILELEAVVKSNILETSNLDDMAEDSHMERNALRPGTVSVQEQNLILHMHEIYRSEVDATNMMKLRYHIGIAQKAQTLANSCAFKQDTSTDRAVDDLQSVHFGQNICIGSCSWADCISNWANEKNNFEYGIGSRNGRAIGNYTQMVLWKAMAIGCGFNSCNGTPFFVCNYAYGEYPNEQNLPYKSGEQCADCPISCTKQGFCDCGGIFCTTNFMVMSPKCVCQYWWTI